MEWWHAIPKSLKLGAIAGLIPFIFNISTLSQTSSGGVTTCSYFDFVGLIGGAIAILAAGSAMMPARAGVAAAGASPGLRYGLGIVVLALGVVQVLRGLGMIMGPCA